MNQDKPIIICLTPIKNEGWILERFLKCTSLWADYIIIADQNSTDNSVEIASKFSKVIVVKNEASKYNETSRQQLLLNEARKIPGRKLLFTLDADEFLSGNFAESLEWQTLLNMPEGTIGAFRWINVFDDFKQVSIDTRFYGQWAYMDNGAPHVTTRSIHSPRIPIPNGATHINFNDIYVMHYNYIDDARNTSKKRWYMCWELLNSATQDQYTIFVKYIQGHSTDHHQLKKTELNKDWFKAYTANGIDMTSYQLEQKHYPSITNSTDLKLFPFYWWDFEVLAMIEKYGANTFAQLDIWNFDWEIFARSIDKKNTVIYKDPRTAKDLLAIKWIQQISSGKLTGIERKIKAFLLYRFLLTTKPAKES